MYTWAELSKAGLRVKTNPGLVRNLNSELKG